MHIFDDRSVTWHRVSSLPMYQSPAQVAPLPPTLLEFGKNKQKHMLNDKFCRSHNFARTLSFENSKNNGNPLARRAPWYLDKLEENSARTSWISYSKLCKPECGQ